MSDIHEQCLDALVRATKGLKLPSVPAEEIRKRRLEYRLTTDGRVSLREWERGVTFFPIQEMEAAGTIGRNDIGYGCGCVIVLPADHGQSALVGRAPEIRAKIRRKFIDQKLTIPGMNGLFYQTTKVAHLPLNQPRDAHRFEVSSLLIRCWVREPRG